MKLGALVLGIVIVALAAIVGGMLSFGNLPWEREAVTVSPATDPAKTPPSATVAPRPKVKSAKPPAIDEAKAAEKPPSPQAEEKPPSSAPATAVGAEAKPSVPQLPFPGVEDVRVGSTASDLLTGFHAPSLRTTSEEHGQLRETYVYSPEKSSQETWVVLRDGRVEAKYTTPQVR